MFKYYFLIAAFVLSVSIANADIYSINREMNKQGAQASAINEAANSLSKDSEMDIMDVIKEKPVVPAGSHKSSFTFEKGKMDATNFYGAGGTNVPAGVNNSKTIYTDDLGRLHFFGKGNIKKD